ncbi:MAG TPA: RDD family protein [Anaerolineales bacterium]|nr:RDD family protein [Anaerolineales bacterium]
MQEVSEFEIQTPERVSLGYALADIGARFMACAIDTAIIGVILLFINGLVFVLMLIPFESVLLDSAFSIFIGLLILLQLAVFLGYYIFFEQFWNGQTPGKYVLGLRVLNQQGVPVSFAEVVIRNLLRLADFLPGSYTVGVVSMLFNRQGLRLGDLAAGTMVVYDQKKVALEQVKNSLQAANVDATMQQFEHVDLPLLDTAGEHAGIWHALQLIQTPQSGWLNRNGVIKHLYQQILSATQFSEEYWMSENKANFLRQVYLYNLVHKEQERIF